MRSHNKNALRPLQGLGVLITRPIRQAQRLAEKIKQEGGVPFVFPSLAITYLPHNAKHLSKLEADDILIFISQHAVVGLLEGLDVKTLDAISKHEIAAVGNQTKNKLEEYGLNATIFPEQGQQNTQGLLKHRALQNIKSRGIKIIRGQAGRETLKQDLQSRGAMLEYIQSYQRDMPKEFDAKPIIKALKKNEIQAVMLTSHDAFVNLMQMLEAGAKALLKDKHLVLASKRMADKIQMEHGFKSRQAENASDEAMMQELMNMPNEHDS